MMRKTILKPTLAAGIACLLTGHVALGADPPPATPPPTTPTPHVLPQPGHQKPSLNDRVQELKKKDGKKGAKTETPTPAPKAS